MQLKIPNSEHIDKRLDLSRDFGIYDKVLLQEEWSVIPMLVFQLGKYIFTAINVRLDAIKSEL